MKYFIPRFSTTLKYFVFAICSAFLFSSCVLIVLGIEKMNEKKTKKKELAKAEMLRQRYKPERASGLCLLYSQPESITFGSKRDLKLVLTIKDSAGTKFPYYAGGEQVQWSDFTFNVQGGYIDDKGKLHVERRLEKCPGGKIVIKASYKNKPGIDTTLTFDLINSKLPSIAGFKGKAGRSGYSGHSGTTGRTGNYGNSSDHGCTEGGEGTMGGNGENGSEGPEVIAYVKKVKFPNMDREVIMVKSINLTNPDTSIAYFDINKEIMIYATGGDGGHGGSGGSGGTGGHWNAQSSSNSYMCKGGRGGDAGDGADGGNGGSLKVYVDPNAEMYMSKIKLNTDGGAAGLGGYAGPGGYGNKPYSQSPSGRPGQAGRKGQRGQKYETVKQKLGDDVFR